MKDVVYVLFFLDLSTAFDTVDHTVFCNFLENYIGLDSHALNFLSSYLAEKTQHVSVKSVLSEMNRLIYGIPQGSVLGPIKFCLYTLPLSAILNIYKIEYHIYIEMIRRSIAYLILNLWMKFLDYFTIVF